MIYIRHRENKLNTALTFPVNAKETVVGDPLFCYKKKMFYSLYVTRTVTYFQMQSE